VATVLSSWSGSTEQASFEYRYSVMLLGLQLDHASSSLIMSRIDRMDMVMRETSSSRECEPILL
jgi:hypothetical protein